MGSIVFGGRMERMLDDDDEEGEYRDGVEMEGRDMNLYAMQTRDTSLFTLKFVCKKAIASSDFHVSG